MSSFFDGLGRAPACPTRANDTRPQRQSAVLRQIAGIGLSFLLLAGWSVPASAQVPQASARGLTWLQQQVGPDGALASEDGSVALPLQSRAETAATLKLLATVPPALSARVAAPDDDNTEFLARQVIGQAQAGSSAPAALAELVARQNRDGGYGGAFLYASNPLDTAWAMLARQLANGSDAAATARAVAYLLSTQETGGGFGVNREAPHAFITATVVSALQAASSSPAALDAINRATVWMLAQQASDGGWGSVPETASVYLALLGSVSDTGLQTSVQAYLLGRQGADGAWNGDPYATSLALRALAAQVRPLPTTGSISLRVIDATGGAGLPQASAQLSTGAIAPALADPTGKLVLTQVPAGTYQMTVSAPGYGAVQLPVSLRAGTTADLGVIALNVASTTGLLKGVIRDAGGAALADAVIAVSGAAVGSTVSGADGAFQLSALTPGAISITVSKTGYGQVSATGTMVAGAALVFSPTLPREGEPGAANGSLRGRVIDAATLAPLAGVSVTLGGTALATTSGADGSFALADIAPGTYVVGFARAGYAGKVSGAVLVSAGSVIDFQVVGMNKAQTTVTVQGTVTDLATGTPVALATVAVGGSALLAQTDSSGNFRLEGLAPGEATVRFSASGYAGETVSTTFATGGDYRLDKTLARDNGANPSFTAFATDSPAYPAYAPVTFQMEVANTSADAVTDAVIDITVFGPQGQVVNYQQAIRLDADGVAQNLFVVAPNSREAFDAKWSTQAYAPGLYQVKARLFRESAANGTRTVLAERSTALTIVPTRSVPRLAVTALPAFTTFDAAEELTFKVEASNQSNEAVSVPFTVEMKDPAGTVLYTAGGAIALGPNEVLGSAVLGPFAHRFAASGIYPVLLAATGDVAPGAVVHGKVQVAPGIRVEPLQSITPAVVTPDGNKRIRIQLQLKGVEQK